MEEKQDGMFANYSAMIVIGVVITIVGFVLGFGADGLVNVVMMLGMLLVIVGYLRRIARALEKSHTQVSLGASSVPGDSIEH